MVLSLCKHSTRMWGTLQLVVAMDQNMSRRWRCLCENNRTKRRLVNITIFCYYFFLSSIKNKWITADEIITRECLSSLTFRSDIPADHYEGCRPAAKDVRLGHYVNNSIKEIDVHRYALQKKILKRLLIIFYNYQELLRSNNLVLLFLGSQV